MIIKILIGIFVVLFLFGLTSSGKKSSGSGAKDDDGLTVEEMFIIDEIFDDERI